MTLQTLIPSKLWPLKALKILDRICKGELLTYKEMKYFSKYIPRITTFVPWNEKKIWTGWTGNGIIRAKIVIQKEKERMAIEGFNTGNKEDNTPKTQVKLSSKSKVKVIKPKLKVKLS